ncbi:MAG: type II toxin-antitoxin system RelE/ParE family toxin [Chitinophagaceae bacterium]|nr:type II toxin-antitoxin system RelE/ParE family toxin [Chitinophagaceae bacterium]
MRKLKVVFYQTAVEDLEEIWLYTFQTWSLEQADRYQNLIYKEIEFLAGKPASGKDCSHMRKDYRSAKIRSHLIFYKYSSSEIEIIRILHESMDIPNRLND